MINITNSKLATVSSFLATLMSACNRNLKKNGFRCYIGYGNILLCSTAFIYDVIYPTTHLQLLFGFELLCADLQTAHTTETSPDGNYKWPIKTILIIK